MAARTVATSITSKVSGSDIVTNLANFLPTGTFLAFQAVAPLFTNNGLCGQVEKIMTALLLVTFAAISYGLSFTDSVTLADGHHYYGIVTPKGLFNPQFASSGIDGVEGTYYNDSNSKFKVTFYDFINASISVAVLATLTLLTAPVSTCYFPHIPSTILKSVPILIGIIAGLYFSFAPAPRKGVGYAITGLVSVSDTTTASDLEATGTPSTTNNNVAAISDGNTATPRPSSATGVDHSSTQLLTDSQKVLTSSSPLHTQGVKN